MTKKAEILRKCISCHDKHMCQKSRKSRGGGGGSCISGLSVLQKVTIDAELRQFMGEIGKIKLALLVFLCGQR